MKEGNIMPTKIQMKPSELINELQEFSDLIDMCQDSDLITFKSTITKLRTYLQSLISVEKGYISAYNHFVQNYTEQYLKFKIKFTHAENFFERIIELDENENVIHNSENDISLNNLDSCLTDEFNKLFFNDVKIEIDKLKKYITANNFVMVGCGSLPITLLAFCSEFPSGSFIGIDNSPEAIRKAIDIKSKFNIENLNFDIIDGMNYDYKNANTIFVANTVVPKMKVLKQIAMSAESKTKIIIRIPVMSGNLISEDVIYNSIPRIRLLEEVEPDAKTDDMLYKLLVLEIR